MSATRTDLFGQAVTLSASGDMEAWNAMQLGFLAHSAATPDSLTKVIESDADFAMPLICKGLFTLLLGRRELYETAAACEREARAAIARRPVTAREMVFLTALSDYSSGNPRRAADALDQSLMHHRNDMLAMKLVQAIRFMLGDATGMRASIELCLPHFDKNGPAFGYALGCHAFTLEETGDYYNAELIGRKAVALCPDDAWGLHAVAHVHDMTNAIDDGIEWLSNRRSAWAHCNNFRYHVWWHLALMRLDRGEIDAVFELYDRHIRADHTDDYRDISNAASLLARLELDGHKVGNRWEELADLCEKRTDDGCLAFADLHYVLALTGGGRDDATQRLISRMKRDSRMEASETAAIFAKPGLDAAQGLEAFGEGDFVSAFRHLAGGRDAMCDIGGSHAQRDVFEQLTIEAALRGGYHDSARRFLDDRSTRRNGNVDRYAAERYALLDDGSSAQTATVANM
ncbi:tetratricopeptide repeat protein [Ahrensia sp. R2A130]|uniref:tetratricopeptide repeat protein n=1 Tax=Ahrensia sp. R2A130 TaxID=744979 RepID=UPI0001E0D120|nr:tetratricopeptide repeat protein [Ahrensia sp. R2A130]EFL87890.1 putative tetratricopeptide repeat protein 38 [Ahrensia sp. R2A130]